MVGERILGQGKRRCETFLKLEMDVETQCGIERVSERRLCRTGFCDDDVALLENSPWMRLRLHWEFSGTMEAGTETCEAFTWVCRPILHASLS